MNRLRNAKGNYAEDRHQWQQHYSVESLAQAIMQASDSKNKAI